MDWTINTDQWGTQVRADPFHPMLDPCGGVKAVCLALVPVSFPECRSRAGWRKFSQNILRWGVGKP